MADQRMACPCVPGGSACKMSKHSSRALRPDEYCKIAECTRLTELLNTPETESFDRAVPLESAHQQDRWGASHDNGKNPEDWFWFVGYLAGKALSAMKAGDDTKAKYHCISAAAALRNWHAHIREGWSLMRPGVSQEKQSIVDSERGD